MAIVMSEKAAKMLNKKRLAIEEAFAEKALAKDQLMKQVCEDN